MILEETDKNKWIARIGTAEVYRKILTDNALMVI